MRTIARILVACLALTASAAYAQSEWNTAQYDLYPGDFNGDSKTDLLYVALSPNKESGIALSDGTRPIGGYQVWTASAFGIPWHSRVYRPVIGDFNWDGRADIFMHRQTGGDHYLLLANSDGTFAGIAQTIPNVSSGLTWSGDQHRIISVAANDPLNPNIPAPKRGHRLFLQAVGRGGSNALIATSNAGLIGGPIGTPWGDGYQTFQWNLQQAIVHSGDFNGDGNGDLLIQAKPDILLIDYDVAIPVPRYRPNSFGIVFSPIGSAGYQFWDRMAGGADWSATRSNLVITDVDGNGRDDVLVQSKSPAGNVRLALGNATTNQLTTSSTATVSFSGSGSVGGDVYRILAGNFDGGSSGGVYLQATSASGTDLIAASVPSGGGTATTTSQSQQSQAPVSNAVGSLPGVADVSSNGAATYEIPLWVPTGTNDLQPELALAYSSQGGGGQFGLGWGLKGISAIARCVSTKAQNNLPQDVRNIATDRFCLDGNQLKLVSGAYAADGSEYRTEIETFSRIKAYGTAGTPQYFKVERKDGLIYEYGNTGDSQVLSVGQTTARVWAVNKISDRAGNAIVFSYTEDATNGGFRINEILYTSNVAAGLSARYKVKFLYESLPVGERYLTYQANSIINQVSRAYRIEVQYDNAVVRYYSLTYELSNANRSRLAAIQACTTALQCLPATTFAYQNGTPGLGAKVDSPNSLPLNNYVLPMDVNGDGRKDLVYPSSATDGAGTWKLALANSSGNYDAGSDASGSPVTNTDFFRAIPFDYNADGFEDLLLPKASSSNWWVMFGSTSGLGSPQDTGTPRTTTGRARGIDVDGDGYQDLVYTDIAPNWVAGDAVRYRLRVPSGGGSFAAPTTVVAFAADTNINDAFGDIYSSAPDFNGDGRGDIMYRYTTRTWHEGSQSYTFVTRLVAYCPGGTSFSTDMSNSAAPHFGDMNGDGRTDLFYVVGFATAAYRMRLSTGTSFTAEIPAFSANDFGLDYLLDWDGDGMDDVLARKPSDNNMIYVFRSLGDGFATGVSTGIAFTNNMGGISPVDVNGDGLKDFAYWDIANSNKWSVRLHNGVMPDLLTSVTDGFGMTTSFSYAPLTTANYTKGTTAQAPEQDYRGSLHVVATVTSATAITSPSTFTKTYEYRGARMNLLGRGFLGFSEILLQDSRNNLWEHSTYDQAYPYIGALKQQKVYLPNKSTVIGQVDQNWTKHDYGSAPEGRSLPFIHQTITGQRGLDGVQLTTVVQNVSVDAATGTTYDTTTTTTELATANGVQSGAEYTQRVYHPIAFFATDTTNWCLGMPGETQLSNWHTQSDGVLTRRMISRNWDTTKCRLNTETLEPGHAQLQVITALTYDDAASENDPNVGHATKVQVTGVGMLTRETKLSWGTDGRFLRSVSRKATNTVTPVWETTSYDWDVAKGLPIQSTDPTSLVVNWSYDNFGRRIREGRPDGTATTWSFNRCTGTSCIGDSSLRWYVHSTEFADGGSIINSADKYFDVAGRVRFEDTPTLSGIRRVESRYDVVGRLAQQTLPYSVGNTAYWQTFGFDLSNRVTGVSRPLSPTDTTAVSTTIAYAGLTTTVTDALARTQTRVENAVGITARSQDAAGYYQNFVYNAFGDLTSVTDSASNTLQTIGYNLRGMKTSMTDMDAGSWTYQPNALGEIEFIRDAKTTAPAWTTEMTYDVLGRMVTRKDVPENVTSTFTFSTTAQNIGRLTQISGGGHTEDFEYYPSTGKLKKRTINSDAQYIIDYTYNALGLLDVLQYPTSTSGYRFAVRHEYSNGFLSAVADNQAPGTVFWRASGSDAFGNVTSEQLGNGLQTTRTFDAVTGLINSIQTVKAPNTPAQNLTYLWDKVGNLRQRKDVQQSLTEDLYYDNLNRLDCSTLNVLPPVNCATQTVGKNLDVDYNQLGNITSKTGLGTYTYHASRKHQLLSTSSGGHAYNYDLNGNMSSRDGSTITWYSYNLPNTINGAGGSSSQFFYTAERDRWKQVAMYGATEEQTIYIGGLIEKVRLGGAGGVTSWRHYIAGGSGSVAVYTRKSAGADELHYLTRDHLGSVDSISNSTGTVEAALSYGAFGERRNATGWTGNPTASNWTEITDGTRRGFTSHEMLDNLNLTHMNGRVYDQISGRFLSPDPFVPDPGFTQSFNRYSYVYNNPLRYTDPSGFMPSPDDPPPGNPNWCNWICGHINITFEFHWGTDLWDLRSRRVGTPPPVTPLRGGPTVVPVKNLERDQVGGDSQRTLVQKVGAFMYPNVTALGERGVPGSAVDNIVGGLKATYNTLLGLATAASPHLAINAALGTGPQPLAIADNELAGAALVEGVTAVLGASGLTKSMLTRVNLVDKAARIRNAGLHPAARNNRTIAVGEDAGGRLYAGSSNGFDRGQRAAAEALGIKCVSCKAGAHAEENLLREVPGLRRVGTSKRSPCGPAEHNCRAQLEERGVDIEN